MDMRSNEKPSVVEITLSLCQCVDVVVTMMLCSLESGKVVKRGQ
jgi:hypothetical protein